MDDFRTSPRDGMFANPTKLVHCTETSNDGEIVDVDMARQSAVIGEDHGVSNHAVMGNMGVGQEMVAVADHGPIIPSGGAVRGDKFPETIVVADNQMSRFALVLQILGLLTDGAVSEKAVAITDLGRAAYGHMMLQLAVGTDADRALDDAVRPHHRIGSDLGLGIDDGGRVDAGFSHGYLVKSENISSPSETTLLFTVHLQTALPRLRRALVNSTCMNRVSPGNTGLRNLTLSALMK